MKTRLPPVWFLALVICLALPFLVFSWGTLAHLGPSVQIVGHYVPTPDLGEDTKGIRWAGLGIGSREDLRLSEALIPEHLGQLGIASPGRLVYRHEAAHRGAIVTTPTGWTSTEDRSVGFLSLPEGDRSVILVGMDEASERPAALTAACTSAGRQGKAGNVDWARVEILAAEGLWIPDALGQMRVVLVPLALGAHRLIGETTLAALPSEEGEPELWLLPGARDLGGCDAACLAALGGVAGAANLGSWTGGVSEELERALRKEPGFGGEVTGEIRRVAAPRAWLRVGDHAPRPILPGGFEDSQFQLDRHAVEVFRKGATGETTAIVLRPLTSAIRWLAGLVKSPAPLLVARSDSRSPSVRVFECGAKESCLVDGEDCPEREAGWSDLGADEWLVAGNGVHYRARIAQAGGGDENLELWLEEPPTGRARLFPSLAASRFKAHNRRIPVGACTAGSTVLRGTTDQDTLPPGVEPSAPRVARSAGDEVATVSLPGWIAREHPEVQVDGRTGVDVARVCVDDGGMLQLTAYPPKGEGLNASAAVADGEVFRSAGHIFRYAARAALLEQVVPLVGFAIAVLVGAVFILQRLSLTARREAPPLSLTIGVMGVAVLMVTGALLQMHMAATDTLLGSPDYVHRHLVTGWFALIAFAAAVEVGALRGEKEDGWDRCYRCLRAVAVGLSGLTLHAAADGLIWAKWGAPDEQVTAGEMVRAGSLSFGLLLGAAAVVFAASAWGARRVVALPLARRPDGAWAHFLRLREGIGLRLRHTWSTVRAGEREEQPRGWAAVAWVFSVGVGAGLRSDVALERRLSAHVRDVRGWRKLVAFLDWFAVRLWDLLFRRPVGEKPGQHAFSVGWLLLAMAIMAVGAAWAAVAGSRSLAGFDLKLSEFSAVLVGLGFGGMLAGFSREYSARSWFVPARALTWTGLLLGVLVLLYAVRGDLGPLMVIGPAVLVLVFSWTFEWHGVEGGESARRVLERLAIFLVLTTLSVSIAVGLLLGLEHMQDTLSEVPLVGSSLSRAMDRMGTYTQSWYTTPGWWTTRAHWIAAGYYGAAREVYLSNLHSDLAFTALLQSYGTPRTLLVLGLYCGVIAALYSLGEELLRGAGLVHQTLQKIYDSSHSFGIRNVLVRETERQARRMASVGYLAMFAGAYVAMELLVHVGTCFNTTLQTGITLPWVSSGGSAAVGFALLVGLTLGLGASSLRQLPTTREAWDRREAQMASTAQEELAHD